MKNKYRAYCFVCQQLVHVGDGETNMFNGKWLTRHASDLRCIPSSRRPPAPPQHYVKTLEEELNDAELMAEFSATDFEDAMGIGWER